MNDEASRMVPVTDSPPAYWLCRFVMLRFLGVIYAIAFLVAVNQILPLIGSNGLTPAGIYLKQVRAALGSTRAGFFELPSLFWLDHSDETLLTVSWIGFALSCVVVAGFANAPVMAILWVLDLSIVHVGQEWYSYGWEIQLIETGFLAIFLCPLADMRPFPRRAPPFPIIVLFRWLIFRIMMGAGLIKLRGDKIWRNGTALYYHFETQPLPGPLSRWFHFLPRAILRIGVWFNFLAELVAPVFVFGPRVGRHLAGAVIVLFQLTLIGSGNLSFFNWLTILPALACFDDRAWSKVLPKVLARKAQAAAAAAVPSRPMAVTAWVVTILVGLLSIPPAFNLLSPGQLMNSSYDPVNLVNTYGAFGTVGQERMNVVFEGTPDDTTGGNTHWKPYHYKGLPVDTCRRPPQIAPYQLHFDWQMWFAAMDTPDNYPWTYLLVWKLLHNDPMATELFADNPFAHHPPRYIRAVLYRYSFAKAGSPGGSWWHRIPLNDHWIAPTAAGDTTLRRYLQGAGWIP